jgi:hypothetical protein
VDDTGRIARIHHCNLDIHAGKSQHSRLAAADSDSMSFRSLSGRP